MRPDGAESSSESLQIRKDGPSSGHRCGAYHNASDAKVNIRKPFKKNIIVTMSDFWCVYVPCVEVVRGLYMFPLLLAVVAIIVVLMPILVTLYA